MFIAHLHQRLRLYTYNWMNEFKCDRTSTCNAPRTGRPIEAATLEIFDKIHDIVLTDRRVKVRELVEAIGISYGTVISILYEQLEYDKAIDKIGAAFSLWTISAIV